jgi:hypothetical protein
MTVEAATIYEVWTKSGGENPTWSREERLVLAEFSRPVWPEVPTAHFRAVLADVGAVVPARMETGLGFASYDQEILVKRAGVGGQCVFWGRVSGRAPAWNAQGESVEFVARHAGAVLADFYILGSHGRGYADYDEAGAPIAANQTYFSGWPAILNPDGRGNMSVTGYEPGETEVCRLFSPPFYRDASARWTTKRFLAYLFYWAQQDSALIAALAFPDLSALGESDLIQEPRDWAAEGRSWWEAIGAILEAEGWRCRLGTSGTGTSPQAVLSLWRIGSGTPRTLVLGAAGGNVTAADNAQQGHLNFDASGLVTTPQVAGGPLIVEGTFRLYPGWTKADLDYSAVAEDDDVPEENDGLWTKTYYKRYVAHERAVDFLLYSQVGRRWVLNEGGDFSLAAYGSPPTFNPDTQIGQGVWCMRTRPFSKPLSWDSLLRPLPALVEVSYDAGAHWHKLDVSLLEDEAGIYIGTTDLSRIDVPEESNSTCDSYWGALCEDVYGSTDNVRVRVTACLADDSALVPDPALSVPAGAMIQRPVQHPYDRRTQYDKRVRLTTGSCASRWVGVCAADTRNHQANLTAEAQAIQAVTACLAVRGPVELFGTEWPYDPGDVITKIAGREIDLEAGGGEGNEIYAEVVSVLSRHLESQSMEVVLEDARMRLGPGGTAGGRPGGRG